MHNKCVAVQKLIKIIEYVHVISRIQKAGEIASYWFALSDDYDKNWKLEQAKRSYKVIFYDMVVLH